MFIEWRKAVSHTATPKNIQSIAVDSRCSSAHFRTSHSTSTLSCRPFPQGLPPAFFLSSISCTCHLVSPLTEHAVIANLCSLAEFQRVRAVHPVSRWVCGEGRDACLFLLSILHTSGTSAFPYPLPCFIAWLSATGPQTFFFYLNFGFKLLPPCWGSDFRFFFFPLWFTLLPSF